MVHYERLFSRSRILLEYAVYRGRVKERCIFKDSWQCVCGYFFTKPIFMTGQSVSCPQCKQRIVLSKRKR